jgi:hypothetical protein
MHDLLHASYRSIFTKLQISTCRDTCFFRTRFYHNRRKNDPQDLKKGLERRVPRFCTICDKNQPLNGKNEKVMAILVPLWMGLNF